MEIANYYITTLTNAGTKLGPLLILCVVGYFFFFKSSTSAKPRPEVKKNIPIESNPEVVNQTKSKTDDFEYQERLKKAREKKSTNRPSASEEIFELQSGQLLSKKELKKRYYDLLKMNHPDKVAALGGDFKKLAERKTKEINSAYEELKKKAS